MYAHSLHTEDDTPKVIVSRLRRRSKLALEKSVAAGAVQSVTVQSDASLQCCRGARGLVRLMKYDAASRSNGRAISIAEPRLFGDVCI